MTEALTARQISELAYLGRSPKPLWWGVIERDPELRQCPELREYVEAGLIEQVGKRGFVLTPRGRKTVRYARPAEFCAHCGAPTARGKYSPT